MQVLEEFLSNLRDALLQGSDGGLEARVLAAREALIAGGVLPQTGDSLTGSEAESPHSQSKSSQSPSNGVKEARRKSSVPFHIHRNAPFLDEVTLEARHWVHFNRLCKHGHWHGTAHPAHDCKLCVSSCGGGAWSRQKKRDGNNKLMISERKRISSLLTQAMHIAVYKARRANPYRDFSASNCIGPVTADKIVYHVPTASFRKKPIQVRIEGEPFAEGSMRRCWRMIETDNGGNADACVAKQYFRGDASAVLMNYWIDTKMQSIAKHYASAFSRHPACWDTVDFIEAYMIRLLPPQKSLYSVEHFLEGNYVKYNNNSGYCLASRSTPQAFSHYTYAKSMGQLMVVDIQGVGDLYTDPQIHTANGKDFGEGNLGVTGFALFFQTHECNHICKGMDLRPFEVFSDFVSKKRKTTQAGNKTVKRLAKDLNVMRGEVHHDVHMNGDGTLGTKVKFSELRPDARVPTSLLLNGGRVKGEYEQSSSSGLTQEMLDINAPLVRAEQYGSTIANEVRSPLESYIDAPSAHDETMTNPPDDCHSECDETTDAPRTFSNASELPPPSAHSSRGDIHLRLAELHAQGRFTENEPHVEAAFYHLQLAAMYESIPGLLGLARMYSGLDRDFLPGLIEIPEMRDLSIILLEKAFDLGSYDAACALAALVTEGFIPPDRRIAVRCLQQLLGGTLVKVDHNFGWRNFEVPVFRQRMQLAEHLEKLQRYQEASAAYSEAADEAMTEGRGAAATKLYMKAEETAALDDECSA